MLVDGRRPGVGGSVKACQGGISPRTVPLCAGWKHEREPPRNFRWELGNAVLYYCSVLQRRARHAVWGTFIVENCLVQSTEFYLAYRHFRRMFRRAPAARDYIDQMTVSRTTTGTDIGPELTGLFDFYDQVSWDAVAELPAWDNTVSMCVRESVRARPGEPTPDGSLQKFSTEPYDGLVLPASKAKPITRYPLRQQRWLGGRSRHAEGVWPQVGVALGEWAHGASQPATAVGLPRVAPVVCGAMFLPDLGRFLSGPPGWRCGARHPGPPQWPNFTPGVYHLLVWESSGTPPGAALSCTGAG